MNQYPIRQDKPAPVKQVQLELDEFDRVISNLDEALDRLGEQLSSVMHSSNPACDEGEGPPLSDVHCELAREIGDRRRHVRRFIEIVQDLRERLEI